MKKLKTYRELVTIREPAECLEKAHFAMVGEDSHHSEAINLEDGVPEQLRELQFENAFVRVWKTIVAPGESLEFHQHDTDRVIVGLRGGKLKRIETSGSQSDLHFDTHKAYWLEADALHGMHRDVNASDESIEIMVVEMKLPMNSPLPSIPLE